MQFQKILRVGFLLGDLPTPPHSPSTSDHQTHASSKFCPCKCLEDKNVHLNKA